MVLYRCDNIFMTFFAMEPPGVGNSEERRPYFFHPTPGVHGDPYPLHLPLESHGVWNAFFGEIDKWYTYVLSSTLVIRFIDLPLRPH